MAQTIFSSMENGWLEFYGPKGVRKLNFKSHLLADKIVGVSMVSIIIVLGISLILFIICIYLNSLN
jgi:hypothetical protein